mmetsp:Transcript_8025/g.15941  ORF Transcript_8025/g.15941 Transcript_8025/m.15941 type:complete len:85 (+) Transcript_8025:1806-2060(+)
MDRPRAAFPCAQTEASEDLALRSSRHSVRRDYLLRSQGAGSREWSAMELPAADGHGHLGRLERSRLSGADQSRPEQPITTTQAE